MHHRINVLFVCSRNKWRSRTAETIYKSDSKLNVKSAGTEQNAIVKVDYTLVNWAEVIFVMEKKHKEFLQRTFSLLSQDKISILDIPDEYKYMDVELIEMIQSCVNNFFK
jgi:protein-tyrosine phosphatase